ncbi:hypothetical protein AQZ49_21550 [Novosphingobium sp. FSW06-99]|nr:hypothetical protein AQZ49_21550 [Novosphingobium sp. FSW06-99]
MFSLDYPQALPQIRTVAYGYQPMQFSDGGYCLIIKASKEVILTARANNSFKIYIIPDVEAPDRALGFVSAFFDDHDEPLALFTPLFSDDDMLRDLGSALSQDNFELYFFDEHSRELMGVCAQVADVGRFRKTLSSTSFPNFEEDEIHATLEAMTGWYGLRGNDHEALAFEVCLGKRLYPDDLVIMDFRNLERQNVDLDGGSDFAALEDLLNPTSLERKEPGAFQERDIFTLLRRCFSGDEVFLNPVREDTGKELCDLLVISEGIVLLVQAKDSPNTEASLRRSIARKKIIIRDHIKKASRQLRGAIRHVHINDKVAILTTSGPKDIDIRARDVFGLVVVNEMFDDDFRSCSTPVLAVAKETKRPCVLVDYAALHTMALHLPSEGMFLGGLIQIFEVALKHGEYPKPRFTKKPPERGAET